jgi:hypothetical protein
MKKQQNRKQEKRPKESGEGKNQSHYTLFCLHSARKALFELSLKGYSTPFGFLV